MKKFQFRVFAMMIMALVCIGFASCSSDDDGNAGGGSHDNKLVGTWHQYDARQQVTTVYRFDSDGKWYYNEWWKSERPEPKYCGQWVTNNGFITMYEEDGGVKNYYRYEISNDGKTLNFYRKDSNGEYTKKGGDYTKQ